MALHNIRKDHGYGEAKIARIAEDLPYNVDLLEEILEHEHFVRDFGPSGLIVRLPSMARVSATATTTINSSAATDITGATITFTPPVDCYAEVEMVFDTEQTVTGNTFVGELVVDGVAQAQQVALVSGVTGRRAPFSQVVERVLLTGGASHTIKLTGRLAVGAIVGSYTIRLVHTGFRVVLTPVASTSEVTQRQAVAVLPDALNGEIAVTFPRPPWWLQGRVQVEVLYGGSVSSANAWRVDLLGNALALADAYTALADVSGSVDVPGVGTLNTAKWYSFSTLLLPVDRSHQMISFRLRRAGGHANDTYAGDVYIHCLRCRYIPGKHEV